MDGRSSIRCPAVTKSTVSKRHDPAATILAKIFTLTRQVSLSIFIKNFNNFDLIKIWMEYAWKITRDYFANGKKMRKIGYYQYKEEVTYALSIAIQYIWHWPFLKVEVSSSAHFDWKRWQIRTNLIFATNRKSRMSFRSAYLHLVLVHSKDQCQGREHFDCEFLANNRNLVLWLMLRNSRT